MSSAAGSPAVEHEAFQLEPVKSDVPETDDHRTEQDESNLLHPDAFAIKAAQPTIETYHRLSLSPAPSGRLSPVHHGPYRSTRHSLPESRMTRLRRFWARNMPSAMVAFAQLFGALMNLSARLLEFEGDGMHPIQVLLVRQVMTAIVCIVYMWWTKTPGFPFGPRDVHLLLVIRGCSGFLGIFGMWYSMMYLPLADATVITFLAPGISALLCYFLLREPFTRPEQLATIIALVGVVLIAKPTALFSFTSEDTSVTDATESEEDSRPGFGHDITAEERLIAVGVALLGVLGAAGAFTTLKTLGKRIHTLISVNAFALTCTVICSTTLIFAPILDIGQPFLRWRTPTSVWQCVLLVLSGLFGFIMQYFLTTGLGMDKSNRATSMVYTHMLFAVAFDKLVFGHTMGLLSFAGCSLILGSAISVVLTKRAPALKNDDVERQANLIAENEDSTMLVSAMPGNAEETSVERGRAP